MDEKKQENPEPSPEANYGVSKKINRDVLKWLILGLAGFVVIVFIFGTGMFVGGIKARFSYQWAESYHKNFAGPPAGFFGDWRRTVPSPGEFIESHGTFGEIIKIDDSDLVVKGQSDVEKVIIITKDTTIEKGREEIKKEELKVGDRIVIIGSPSEEGQIEAKLIRVFNGEGTKPLPMLPRFPL